MVTISVDLPRELQEIELHIFADEHIGDPNSDIKRLRERIDKVANTPNAYCVLNGDIIDNATKTSLGDVYASKMKPMEQLEKACELFSPIKDRILAITRGNHEARTYIREGIDISKLMAKEFDILDRYSTGAAILFIRFGTANTKRGSSRYDNFVVFLVHGTGGGRKEGAKAIRLADMAAIAQADVYIHGHTHLPLVMKEAHFVVDKPNHHVRLEDRLFVNAASNMGYGGYGEEKEYKPNSNAMPVIHLYAGRLHNRMEATL